MEIFEGMTQWKRDGLISDAIESAVLKFLRDNPGLARGAIQQAVTAYLNNLDEEPHTDSRKSLSTAQFEEFAALQHDIWANWMRYMFTQGYTAPQTSRFGDVDVWYMWTRQYDRWQRQMNTPYEKLSEKEKDSDREIAWRQLRALGIEPEELDG